ncbi:ubiquinone/menaquinone biosynthesis C-methylase UbiE [Scopulibacillus darangshiensis]|uniref:Ubiquinone/menaquinone biosynthesis C-methylase UbiE n=1 Tax=Scopulibacillus darangshiensis TaxID=442528 RepID=A0A4V2SMW1_9BACL|nr:class I SAM-dependent methyltransferase [Scopulibacillus darangshiensis]TCP28836.1 ubiquinone/menaquinone biosynthesis C-methylase UbiE [Scopulibacillus darangshiensis]
MINFHSEDNRSTYSSRDADLTWENKIQDICDVKGKKVLDIGCGGGIYSKALAGMGAAAVTGLDFSEQQLSSARENCKGYSNIDFNLGNALDTKLGTGQYDIVLERAVIHHIKDLDTCFKEISRLLKPAGICLIQDRTPEDCLLEGSSTHIRGFFFSKYPELINKETSRRYTSEKVYKVLGDAGFTDSKEYKLWETRESYNGIDDLVKDIVNRTGRSILYELSDKEIEDLEGYIKGQLDHKDNEPIVEKDRWTIWKAVHQKGIRGFDG